MSPRSDAGSLFGGARGRRPRGGRPGPTLPGEDGELEPPRRPAWSGSYADPVEEGQQRRPRPPSARGSGHPGAGRDRDERQGPDQVLRREQGAEHAARDAIAATSAHTFAAGRAPPRRARSQTPRDRTDQQRTRARTENACAGEPTPPRALLESERVPGNAAAAPNRARSRTPNPGRRGRSAPRPIAPATAPDGPRGQPGDTGAEGGHDRARPAAVRASSGGARPARPS